jgi:hypothetical protein
LVYLDAGADAAPIPNSIGLRKDLFMGFKPKKLPVIVSLCVGDDRQLMVGGFTLPLVAKFQQVGGAQ